MPHPSRQFDLYSSDVLDLDAQHSALTGLAIAQRHPGLGRGWRVPRSPGAGPPWLPYSRADLTKEERNELFESDTDEREQYLYVFVDRDRLDAQMVSRLAEPLEDYILMASPHIGGDRLSLGAPRIRRTRRSIRKKLESARVEIRRETLSPDSRLIVARATRIACEISEVTLWNSDLGQQYRANLDLHNSCKSLAWDCYKFDAVLREAVQVNKAGKPVDKETLTAVRAEHRQRVAALVGIRDEIRDQQRALDRLQQPIKEELLNSKATEVNDAISRLASTVTVSEQHRATLNELGHNVATITAGIMELGAQTGA